MAKAKTAKKEFSVEDKLRALYQLQAIDTEIDKIKILRGELPLEVEDLEDEIAGLETRIEKFNAEVAEFESNISDKKNAITNAKALIKKYEEQQMNVRNNREFDAISKEIEYQKLEIELAEKRIREAKAGIEAKNEIISAAQERLDALKADLKHKKSELDDIVAETEKEEQALLKDSEKAEKVIDERLVNAYHRVRGSAVNGLAVVPVERNACGGCFSNVPPQRQLDIRSRKKIIVCENCGRILVDKELVEEVTGVES